MQEELAFDRSLHSTTSMRHAKDMSSTNNYSPKDLKVVKRQSSDEDQAMGGQGNTGIHSSTFENSADTYSKSKDSNLDSFSDEEDAVYVPFEYHGDGRKREAKRHKL